MDVTADRGLGHVELVGRLGKAAVLHHRRKDFKLFQVNIAHFSHSYPSYFKPLRRGQAPFLLAAGRKNRARQIVSRLFYHSLRSPGRMCPAAPSLRPNAFQIFVPAQSLRLERMAGRSFAPILRTFLSRSSGVLTIAGSNSANLSFFSIIKIYQIYQFVNKNLPMCLFLYDLTVFTEIKEVPSSYNLFTAHRIFSSVLSSLAVVSALAWVFLSLHVPGPGIPQGPLKEGALGDSSFTE